MKRTLPMLLIPILALAACGGKSDEQSSAKSSTQTTTNDWSAFQGCYTTITYNGQPADDPAYNHGWMKLSDNFGFATMPGEARISSYDFGLYHYSQNNTAYYGLAFVFPNYGTTEISTDGKTRIYSFKGQMICTGMCAEPVPFHLETRLELKDLGNDTYEVHHYRRIPELPDQSMDADDTYLIQRKRENCWTEAQSR